MVVETIIEKEEKKEIIDTAKVEGEVNDIVIEDGKLFVVEEAADEKAAKSDKDEGLSAEDLAKKAEKSDGGSSDTDKEVITESMRVKMLEKKIGSMDKKLADANLSPEAIRQRVPLKDMQTDIKRQRSLLADIDKEINPDEWKRQSGIVTTLEGDIADKKSDAELEKRYKSKDNADFLKNERKSLADKGFAFSDEQFDGIAAAAEEYLDGGMFTREAIQKGLIDIIGASATDKLYQVSSEQKLRSEIKDAAIKVTKSVRVTRSGVSAKLTSLTDRLMNIKDGDVLKRELRKLSDEQYAMYKKERDLIRKKNRK
ncbi:MAG: hypothetical protein GWP19_03245 [Planctomycetia bacterium]|nr:hypothetical protein [Planctomycetia bacterium]